jgi:hypothetical protein
VERDEFNPKLLLTVRRARLPKLQGQLETLAEKITTIDQKLNQLETNTDASGARRRLWAQRSGCFALVAEICWQAAFIRAQSKGSYLEEVEQIYHLFIPMIAETNGFESRYRMFQALSVTIPYEPTF